MSTPEELLEALGREARANLESGTVAPSGMATRTYRGRSVEEIIPMIQQELGAEAIIVRRRDGLAGGILGFFQHPYVEIEAIAGRPGIDLYDDSEPVAPPAPEPAPEQAEHSVAPPPPLPSPSQTPASVSSEAPPAASAEPPPAPAAQPPAAPTQPEPAAPAPTEPPPVVPPVGPRAPLYAQRGTPPPWPAPSPPEPPVAPPPEPSPPVSPYPPPEPIVPPSGGSAYVTAHLAELARASRSRSGARPSAPAPLPRPSSPAPPRAAERLAGWSPSRPAVPPSVAPPPPASPPPPAQPRYELRPPPTPGPPPVTPSQRSVPPRSRPLDEPERPAPVSVPEEGETRSELAEVDELAGLEPEQPILDFHELIPDGQTQLFPPAADEWAAAAARSASRERRTVAPGSQGRARTGVEKSLRRYGIGHELAQELIEGAMAHVLPLAPRSGLAQAVRSLLTQRIPVAPALPTAGAAIVVVGAGGAGKTTCCATLLGAYRTSGTLPASAATVLRDPHQKELQMILSPQIMRPMPASSQRALRAVRKVRSEGLAVVDTPPLSPSDRAGVRELADLLGDLSPDRVVLALPATLGAAAAAQLLEALAPLELDALAITHADETDQLGVAVEVACRFGLAPEYLLERARNGAWRMSRIDPTGLARKLLR